MPSRKSAGVAGRLGTVALITGMGLVLLGGAFATGVFFHPTQTTTSSTSTQAGGFTISGTSTSSSEGGSTSVSSTSQTSTLASSTSSHSSTSPSRTSSSTSTFTTTTTTSSTTTRTTTLSSRSTTTTHTSTTSLTTSSSTATTTVTSSTATQPGTAQIILPQDVGNNESLNFQPSNIKVVIGVNNTIVWNDQDYVQHTIKSVKLPSGAKSWDSGIMNEGQTFTLVLTVPGDYKYVCTIHPDWMIGTIQVVQG